MRDSPIDSTWFQDLQVVTRVGDWIISNWFCPGPFKRSHDFFAMYQRRHSAKAPKAVGPVNVESWTGSICDFGAIRNGMPQPDLRPVCFKHPTLKSWTSILQLKTSFVELELAVISHYSLESTANTDLKLCSRQRGIRMEREVWRMKADWICTSSEWRTTDDGRKEGIRTTTPTRRASLYLSLFLHNIRGAQRRRGGGGA